MLLTEHSSSHLKKPFVKLPSFLNYIDYKRLASCNQHPFHLLAGKISIGAVRCSHIPGERNRREQFVWSNREKERSMKLLGESRSFKYRKWTTKRKQGLLFISMVGKIGSNRLKGLKLPNKLVRKVIQRNRLLNKLRNFIIRVL